jgi:hypothetical protein
MALMALASVSFAMGCGKKAEETPPAAAEDLVMSSDTTAMGGDSTSMMSADTTKSKVPRGLVCTGGVAQTATPLVFPAPGGNPVTGT